MNNNLPERLVVNAKNTFDKQQIATEFNSFPGRENKTIKIFF